MAITATDAPSLQSISDLVNSINRGAQTQANQARIPGAAGLQQQSSSNIASELSGQLPGDVISQLAQSAAERGVGLGIPGSDNSNASLLRSLGLTSLDLQQTGEKDLSAALARNPAAPIFDPTTQLETPFQSGTLANEAARNQLGSGQLSLEWYKALNPNLGRSMSYGGGGGYSGSGGYGGGYAQPSPSSGSSSLFNNLFPSLPTGGGTTTATGAPFIGGTPSSADTPLPPTLLPNDPGLPDLGLPPEDYNFDPTSGGMSPDLFNTYDPFAMYG